MNPMTSALSKSAGSIALKITIVVAAAIGGAGLVSSNVFAALTATANNTSGGQVTTGTLKLELNNSAVSGITGGFTAAISNMGPGDTYNRYIDLRNTGTLDGATPTLQISSADTSTLTESSTAGLQVLITACSVPWTSAGNCNESSTAVLSSTSVKVLKTAATAITLPSVLTGAVNYLKVSTTLPAVNENVVNGVLPVGSVQGKTASLTWNFVIEERSAITNNG